jgi:UDP-N-acetylglucosamine:LPS N-acetylglucosamine transferase
MRRKKILVLISEGGGGHKSAGESLVEILGSDYDIEVVNAIGTIIEPLDWFKRIFIGKISGEDIYNWLLRNEIGILLKAYIHRGKRHLHVRRKKIVNLFARFLKNFKWRPDLIISTIPFINDGLLLAAKQHQIPYLLLPTDLDVTMFLSGFEKLSREDLSLFKLALAYNRQELLVNVFKHGTIEPQDLLFPGFPIRPACQKNYSPEEIIVLKQELGMLTDRPTITLVMGASGGNAIVSHALEIAELHVLPDGKKIQVNVCAGHNTKSKNQIIHYLKNHGGKILTEERGCTTVESREGILFLVYGFTTEIIKILACSDLVISKTGSCTINEAIYLGKKLLLDYSEHSIAKYLFWEEFNVWFVKRHHLGAAFCKSEELRSLIPFMLKEDQHLAPKFTLPNFQSNIQMMVSSLISPIEEESLNHQEELNLEIASE